MADTINHEQLNHDLSEAVIQLNDQRRELLEVLKEALRERLAAYDRQDGLTVRMRALIEKVEKAAGIAP